jgi:hypothetical protein
MTRQRLASLVIALVFATIAVPVAFAGANDDQYPTPTKLVKPPKTPTTKTPTTKTQGKAPTVNGGVAPLTTKKTTGTLPFTGLDLTVIALLGGSGLVGGVGLRKLGQKRSDS